jgi:hypothetical protein
LLLHIGSVAEDVSFVMVDPPAAVEGPGELLSVAAAAAATSTPLVAPRLGCTTMLLLFDGDNDLPLEFKLL